jgi:hypothetical protein
MRAGMPDRTDAERRARVRTALIVSGLIDLALAGFFLGWGASLLALEYRVAWLIAAVLAAAGVVTLFVATLGFGRKGAGRALDDGEDDEPVVRR